MPEPTLLRMQEITHVGFVDAGANQEADDGAFIEIWKRAPHEGDKTMPKEFDVKSLSDEAQAEFTKVEDARKAAETAQADAEKATTDAEAAQEAAETALEDAKKAAEGDEVDPVEKLSAEAQEVFKTMKAEADERIEKAQTEATEAKKAADEANEIAKAERATRERAEIAAVVKSEMADLDGEHDENVDRLVRAKAAMTAEDYKAHTTQLKAASAQVAAGELFKSKGVDPSGQAGSAWSKVEKMAEARVEAETSPTIEQARAAVLDANPKLYDEYTAEQRDA